MAAYAAVISLKHTINGLLNSSRILPDSSSREILKSAYDETTSLQQALERLDDSSMRRSSSSRERLDAFEGQIRDCAHKLEDVLEFYALKSQEDKYEDEEVRQEITSFAQIVKKLEKDYIGELSSPVTDDGDDEDEAAIISSNIDPDVEMVGSSHQLNEIRQSLLCRMRPYDMFFSLVARGRGLLQNGDCEDHF